MSFGRFSSCLQSVKDTKFESNSQLQRIGQPFCVGCLQSVKDTKFESNSQLYNSETSRLIEEGVADLHCRSDRYLAEEIWREYRQSQP